jgi:hypothetical protein
MSKLTIWAITACLSLVTLQASATPVTVEFTGKVTIYQDSTQTVDPSKSGQEFTGRFTFDPNIQKLETWLHGYGMSRFSYGCSMHDISGACLDYAYFSTPNANIFDARVETAFGNFALQPSNGDRFSQGGIQRVDNDDGGQSFTYSLGVWESTLVSAGSANQPRRYNSSGTQFGLWGTGGNNTLFTDLYDLASLPSIENADQVNFAFDHYSNYWVTDRTQFIDPAGFQLRGIITSLRIEAANSPDSQVPEPSTAVLVFAGLAVLGRVKKVRQGR